MVAVAAKRKTKRPQRFITLREDFVRTPKTSIKVDEAACVISGLKICGLHSDNGRDYAPEALREAAALYEGVPCYTNHRKPGETRDWADDIGVWHNVRFFEGMGLYADLKYDAASPAAQRLVNRAKNLPENIGFSHDADTDQQFIQRQENGRELVTKITEVNSVDLVADPATARGLAESRTMTTTVKAIIEANMPKLSEARQVWAKRLLEMEPMDVEATASDAGGSLDDALKSAVMAILGDESMDGKAKAKAIGDWIKTHEKITAEPEPEAPVAESDKEPDGDEKKQESCKEEDDAEKKKMESRIAELELNLEMTKLVEGFEPTEKQLADLRECTDAKFRRKLAESYKAIWLAANPEKKVQKSRGTFIAPIQESRVTNDDLAKKYRIFE